ncbi:MAG TPA: hypothetical protein VFB76_16710 [Candidatus Angelobacter sp.]|nr:hypothetical protein [Candidatus Angelobacter sp.]
MTDPLSKGLHAAILLSIATVLLMGGCGHPRSTPEDSIPDSDQALLTLIGKQITIRGKFSLKGKIGPYILVGNQEVYLVNLSSTFEWGEPYSEMEGKLVEVTGTLRFYHDPPADPTERGTKAHAYDYFYFEAETTQLQLISGNVQTESRPRRTVKSLPRYMTDIPQLIPPQIKLPDAPKTARNVTCFVSFTTTSSMQDIVRKCGIPDEHQGSGIFIFLYDMNDGTVVAIGTPDLKRLMYINQITERGARSLL